MLRTVSTQTEPNRVCHTVAAVTHKEGKVEGIVYSAKFPIHTSNVVMTYEAESLRVEDIKNTYFSSLKWEENNDKLWWGKDVPRHMQEALSQVKEVHIVCNLREELTPGSILPVNNVSNMILAGIAAQNREAFPQLDTSRSVFIARSGSASFNVTALQKPSKFDLVEL